MPHIRNIHDVEMTPVELDGTKGATMSVMIGREHNAPHFALRSIAVTPGGHTPEHQHDYEHEVFVVSGTGSVLLDGEYHPIRAGDTILVPANERHQFKVPEETNEPLNFLCLVPVEQNCGGCVPGS